MCEALPRVSVFIARCLSIHWNKHTHFIYVEEFEFSLPVCEMYFENAPKIMILLKIKFKLTILIYCWFCFIKRKLEDGI
jgi:hypothetical protein